MAAVAEAKAAKEARKVEVSPSVREAAERVLTALESSLVNTNYAPNGDMVEITTTVDVRDLRRLALFCVILTPQKGRAKRAAQTSAQP